MDCKTQKQLSLQALPEWLDFSHAVKTAEASNSQLRIFNVAGIHVDMTGQRYNTEIEQASINLLNARHFEQKRQLLLEGGISNLTEARPAWHTILRTPFAPSEVAIERKRALAFVQRADSERKWRNIVHIGIGGSDWGVRLLTGAFGYAGTWRNLRIVSNIDGHAIEGGLAGLDPRETLIVIATKSFKTLETLENAQRALEWLKAAGIPNPMSHMIGITSNPTAARAWGISENHIFKFWDWVGGRFSIWSSLGISAALVVGPQVLAGLHSGASVVDQHFEQAPITENIPVQLALSGIANRSVMGLGSLNLSVYDARLANLIPYLQQLEMESLGKSVDIEGQVIDIPTGPVVWGMPGTDGQHTFYQWLHQSNEGAAVDFLMCLQQNHKWHTHHQQLLSNCLAQREALLKGKTYEQALEECLAEGLPKEKAQWLAKHRTYGGGRPSTLFVLDQLNPFTLGALLALYEHKVFVQSVIWGLNPFDQWGVEYGKNLATQIMHELETGCQGKHDISTDYWVHVLQQMGNKKQD